VPTAVIPNRPVFRAQEVCDLVEVQPYVLRTWEAEFPDLGVAKTEGGPRIYRRADVERALRIKHLLFVDGLTLAGVRRRMMEEGLAAPPVDEVASADVAAMIDNETRQHLRDVRRGLQWILGVLQGEGVTPEDFVLRSERVDGNGHRRATAVHATKKPAAPSRAAKSAKVKKSAAKSKRR
jgi:DNA-binding transcriptional MerR regulator